MSHSGKILLIVESPAKCKTITKLLGKDRYSCIASYGHIRELCTNMGIDYMHTKDNYEPAYRVIGRQKKRIDALKKAVNECMEVVLATDDDREGEAIAWHICRVCNLSIHKTKRVIFHEITASALREAMENPRTLDMNMVNAQKARQVLDLLIGFTFTPLLWKFVAQNNNLSAGRCQTPALQLVVDNDIRFREALEALDNEREKTYEPQLECDVFEGEIFTSKSHICGDYGVFFDDFSSFSREDNIVSHSQSESISKPPVPFTTSSLQQTASSELGYSPKHTMSLAQKLYEAGFITYMRTDSTYLSKDFVNNAREYIKKEYGNEYIPDKPHFLSRGNKSFSKDAKDSNAQEAHEAIRPTYVDDVDKVRAKMEPQHLRLYNLIRRRSLASCCVNSKSTIHTISIDVSSKYLFKKSFSIVDFPGWKAITGYKDEREVFYSIINSINERNNEENDIIIPKNVNIMRISLVELPPKLPKHLNESGLIKMLEEKGIGRPSTFASLVDKIQQRNYVSIEDVNGTDINIISYSSTYDDGNDRWNEIELKNTKQQLGNERKRVILQSMGSLVATFLQKIAGDTFFSYEYTNLMENTLDDIAKGLRDWQEVCRKCDKNLREKLEEIYKLATSRKNTDDETSNDVLSMNTIKLDDEYTFKIAKYGPILVHKVPRKKGVNIPLKKSITIEFVRDNNLTAEQLLKYRVETERVIGDYLGKPVIIKKGPYGIYAQYEGEKYNIFKQSEVKNRRITLSSVSQSEVITKISSMQQEKQESLKQSHGIERRDINNECSIRISKYGPYIFYQTKKMKKPKFLSLKKFQLDPFVCCQDELKAFISEEFEISLT